MNHSSPKDISLRQQREDNHYKTADPDHPDKSNGACGGSGGFPSFGDGKTTATACEVLDDDTLPDNIQLYIELKVDHTKEHSGFKKSETSYRRSLVTLAKKNELEMDDLEELVEWRRQEESGESHFWTKLGKKNHKVLEAYIKLRGPVVQDSCSQHEEEQALQEQLRDTDERKAAEIEYEGKKAQVAGYVKVTWGVNGRIVEALKAYMREERGFSDKIDHQLGLKILEELYPEECKEADRALRKEMFKQVRATMPGLFAMNREASA